MTARFTRSDSRVEPPGEKPQESSPGATTPNLPIATRGARAPAMMEWREGQRFAGREIPLSRLAGARQVHVNLMVVPPAKQSCPFHYHMREEEHFFVLEGRCVLRSGESRHIVEPGDYVCFPAGTGVAHAFENPFQADCHILAMGPRDMGEIAVYPDSGKAKLRATGTIIPWPQESLDYWHGENPDAPLTTSGAGDDPDSESGPGPG